MRRPLTSGIRRFEQGRISGSGRAADTENPGKIIRVDGQIPDDSRCEFLPAGAAIYRPVDVIAPSTPGQDVEVQAVGWIHEDFVDGVASVEVRHLLPGGAEIRTFIKAVFPGFEVNNVRR